MPKFYLTLKLLASDKNTVTVFEGNDVLHTATPIPTLEDFNAAKSRYCDLLQDKRIYAHAEQIVITMCVPLY